MAALDISRTKNVQDMGHSLFRFSGRRNEEGSPGGFELLEILVDVRNDYGALTHG
jgi:hypothetical protein